jgi:DNA-binding transcriptional MerR regulator
VDNTKETTKEEEVLYTPKQVSKITGIEPTLLLKWVNYFDIKTKWTQENQQGHRRYTKENIEEILQLKHLIQEKKLSWEQAKIFFEGSEPQFIVDESKTRLEKKMDHQLEIMTELVEKMKIQEEFNKTLLKQLETVVNELVVTKQELSTTKQELKFYIEKNDRELLENLRQSQKEKQLLLEQLQKEKEKEEEKKGFFRRLFFGS